MNPHLIIGNCFAALVACLELAKKGEEVKLISNGGKWGGHFSGIDIENIHYDMGMAVVELTSSNTQYKPDIKSYNPYIRNDVGRFFDLLKKYINEIHPLINIYKPQTYFRERLYEDFFLCNSFDIFKALTAEERSIIKHELEDIDKDNSYHASNKVSNQSIHTEISYETSSLYNHGSFIHSKIIEPYIQKISGFKSKDLSSIFHRRFWSPLYYPETLNKAAAGKIEEFGNTLINYPKNSNFNSFSENLIKKIKTFKSIEIIDQKVKEIDYTRKSILLANGDILEYRKMGWASSLKKLQKTLKIDPIENKNMLRSGLTFDFLLLDKKYLLKEFSVIFIIDENIPCYRVTNQSLCSQSNEKTSKVVVEYNNKYINKSNIYSNEDIHKTSIMSLKEMGIIRSKKAIIKSQVINFPDLLPIPSMAYEENTNQNISMINKSFPEIDLFGESSGIGTRSFADNFIQGIKYAEINTN